MFGLRFNALLENDALPAIANLSEALSINYKNAGQQPAHSALKLFTGFAIAAFMD